MDGGGDVGWGTLVYILHASMNNAVERLRVVVHNHRAWLVRNSLFGGGRTMNGSLLASWRSQLPPSGPMPEPAASSTL